MISSGNQIAKNIGVKMVPWRPEGGNVAGLVSQFDVMFIMDATEERKRLGGYQPRLFSVCPKASC